MNSLSELGFYPYFSAQFELLSPSESLVPARITTDSGSLYGLAGCKTTLGELSGRLRSELVGTSRPTTGDWVVVDDAGERAVVHHVLDRKTELRRRSPSSESGVQLLVANVDLFFIVTSANRDFNPRRILRYSTAIADGGAQAAIVLNKVDLVEDVQPLIEMLEELAVGLDVISVSAKTGFGLELLRERVPSGATVGFVGSSGVGKSSLINRLLGDSVQATEAIRSDGKGRHTTTRRELLVMPGGVLVDTPGMREFGMTDVGGGLDETFSDVAALADSCRFSDCSHEGEPGCAVAEALDSGALSPRRIESYRQLGREIAAAERRTDKVAGANAKRRWKTIHKAIREHAKVDPKRSR